MSLLPLHIIIKCKAGGTVTVNKLNPLDFVVVQPIGRSVELIIVEFLTDVFNTLQLKGFDFNKLY